MTTFNIFCDFLFQLQKIYHLTKKYGSNCTALSYQLDLLITNESYNDTTTIFDYEDLNNITFTSVGNNSDDNSTYDTPQFQVRSTITLHM